MTLSPLGVSQEGVHLTVGQGRRRKVQAQPEPGFLLWEMLLSADAWAKRHYKRGSGALSSDVDLQRAR
jgi:hypothetical protein